MKNILIIEDDQNLAKQTSGVINYFLPEINVCFAMDKTGALNALREKIFFLITLDGNLLNGDHGRDILKEMTTAQKSRTVVHSGEEEFISQCQKNGIMTIKKGDDSFMEKIEEIIFALELRA